MAEASSQGPGEPTWMLLESGRLNLYLESFLFGAVEKLMCDPSERMLTFLLWGDTSVEWDKIDVKEGRRKKIGSQGMEMIT